MRIALYLGLFLLIACSSGTHYAGNAPAVYTVKRGDTLFKIATRYGLSSQAIMRKNNINNPHKIFVGQKLRLKSSRYSSSTKSKKHYNKTKKAVKKYNPIPKRGSWAWPIKGRVITHFNPGRIGANGIRIAGKQNQSVNAAMSGTVAYTGSGLNGYGNVIIIKHNNGLLSAYGFLSKTYVKKGQKVRKKQRIGTVGKAPNGQLMLHFEVRKNGSTVNPLRYTGSEYHF